MSWKAFDSTELRLKPQLMRTPIKTREKCLEFTDATPFISIGDVIITHMLEHSTLSGGKPTAASDWTIFLLNRKQLRKPHPIWFETK